MEVSFESYHKRKKILEEKYGKLLYLKPYNDEVRGTTPFVKANNKIADNKHQITRYNRPRRIKQSL